MIFFIPDAELVLCMLFRSAQLKHYFRHSTKHKLQRNGCTKNADRA